DAVVAVVTLAWVAIGIMICAGARLAYRLSSAPAGRRSAPPCRAVRDSADGRASRPTRTAHRAHSEARETGRGRSRTRAARARRRCRGWCPIAGGGARAVPQRDQRGRRTGRRAPEGPVSPVAYQRRGGRRGSLRAGRRATTDRG